MIEMRRAQRSFGDGLIAAEIDDLREDWMAQADQVLADEALVAAVYEALGKRQPKSKSRGRLGAPAEVVLRLLLLKHIRNWSYEVLEREVRANLVYRDFTRVGAGKTPDAKTMGRWGVALGADVIKQIHTRMVTVAQSHGLTEGRRMRVDTMRRRSGAHARDEEDHQDRGRGRNQAARPQPQREAPRARHRARGALQGQARPGEAQARLRPIAQFHQPCGGTGQAVRQRDYRGREALGRRRATTGA